MSDCAHTDFWHGLVLLISRRPDRDLGAFRHGHANAGYIEFDLRLGLGFRPRAVCLTNGNELRSEILTRGNTAGLSLLDDRVVRGGSLKTHYGSVAEASVVKGRSNGKVQIVWRDAMTLNRRLWPVHQAWIAETLWDLRLTLGQTILRLGKNS